MYDQLTLVADKLRARGFEAAVFATSKEASSFILGDIAEKAQVAIGGSMTVKQMDLHAKLREAGHEVLSFRSSCLSSPSSKSRGTLRSSELLYLPSYFVQAPD